MKLNDVVSVPGKATAYTGVPIGGAKVRYRVVREVRYPAWWYWTFWWRPPWGCRPATMARRRLMGLPTEEWLAGNEEELT